MCKLRIILWCLMGHAKYVNAYNDREVVKMELPSYVTKGKTKKDTKYLKHTKLRVFCC